MSLAKIQENSTKCFNSGSKHRSQNKHNGSGNGNGCHNCGSKHPLKKCPAYRKTCNKKGHLSHIADPDQGV